MTTRRSRLARRCAAAVALGPALLLVAAASAGADGASLVRDIYPGPYGSAPTGLTNVGGTLFFYGRDATHGQELWRSDGTAQGTRLVRDIVPGSMGSNEGYPGWETRVGATLFFVAYHPTADSPTAGAELWRSDGTTAGTEFVHDVGDPVFDEGFSTDYQLTNVAGSLFFVDAGLWRSDGTVTGTTFVKSLSHPDELTNVAGTLFFRDEDPTHGKELWRSDGTAQGTKLVRDILPGSGDSTPRGLTAVGKKLFFSARGGGYGMELWRSDGTRKGTNLVRDIVPGRMDSAPSALTRVGRRIFFEARDPTGDGYGLWRSDGTRNGTELVRRFDSPYATPALELTNVGGILFFASQGPAFSLWRSDGTWGGTKVVRRFSGYWPEDLTNVAGTLFFRAYDAGHGFELWRSDGTSAGTELVRDIHPDGVGDGGSWPTSLTNVGARLFFAADDGTHGPELWKAVP